MEAIQQQAHIKTPAVAARYLNSIRHRATLAKAATKVKHKGRGAVSQRQLSAMEKHGLLLPPDS